MGKTQEAPVRAERIEAYWLPGCTSCLRMREFVEKSGLEFESINAQEQPERAARLEQLGGTTPAVVVGDRLVPGLDLAGIAELLGIDYTPPEVLPTDVLASRYGRIIGAVARFAEQLPESALDEHFGERNRTIRELIAHAGSIMRALIEAYESGYYENRWPVPRPLADTGTRAELVAAARATGSAFSAWWEKFGYDEDFSVVIGTSWGHRPMLEAFERAVWHTAQHARQLMYFLEAHGIAPKDPLTAEDLDGMPLPDQVQA